MSMTELVKIIEDQGKGVRAYIECGRMCRDRFKTHSGQSAAYFLLTVAADKFVEAYDDQPLPSPSAEDEFLHFKSYVDQLEATERETDPAKNLVTLNRVAAEIAGRQLLQSSV